MRTDALPDGFEPVPEVAVAIRSRIDERHAGYQSARVIVSRGSNGGTPPTPPPTAPAVPN